MAIKRMRGSSTKKRTNLYQREMSRKQTLRTGAEQKRRIVKWLQEKKVTPDFVRRLFGTVSIEEIKAQAAAQEKRANRAAKRARKLTD